MHLGYTILEPKHRKYQMGTIYFEHQTEGYYALKRIGFVVDNQKYAMNMLLTKTSVLTSTWIFQKEGSFQAPNEMEIKKILIFVDDIIANYKFQPSMIKILSEIRPQTEIYNKLLSEFTPLEQKKKLKAEFRQKNKLIQRYNTTFSQLLRRRAQKAKNITQEKSQIQ